MVLTIATGAVVALGVLIAFRRLRPNPDPAQIERIVATAYAGEWARALDLPENDLGEGIAAREPRLLRRVDELVSEVVLRFGTNGRRGVVPTEVEASYRSGRARSVAKLALPWEHLPAPVRADILRTPAGSGPVTRTWRAAP